MTVKHDAAQSSTPDPAIQPSSATAFKSASMVAKKARAVASAAVRMLGPTLAAVISLDAAIECPAAHSG